MMQAAPSSPIPAPDAGHPSPPSRLLSKHRPCRRAAASRPPPLPPASTRGQPDLTLCRCCGVRFLPAATGTKRRSVRPLHSHWRIVLLCGECLSLVRSAAICSYCLSLDNLPAEDSFVACRMCNRCVHHCCIPLEHRAALIQPIDVQNFTCIDCCPTIKPASTIRGLASVPKFEAAAMDLTSSARGKGTTNTLVKQNAGSKPLEAKQANEALALTGGGGDLDLPDKKLALQLHMLMNGSQRISRFGNASRCGSSGQGKGWNGAVSGRNGSGNQLLCVTNMMDQLDDDESEADLGSNLDGKPVRTFDPAVTVVLALECVKGKHGQESMRAKRKGPVAKPQIGVVDRYKNKYSKKNSSKQAKAENIERKSMSDGLNMNGNGGGNSAGFLNDT